MFSTADAQLGFSNYFRKDGRSMKARFILYVSDQERSTVFYSGVLGMLPTLNVRGMTEFTLGDSSILGLMPESGIVNLLADASIHPSLAHGE